MKRGAAWLRDQVRLISTKYGGWADKRGKAAKIDFVSEILMLPERSINLVSSAYNARDSSLNKSYLRIYVQSACIKDEFNGAEINHHFVFSVQNACFSHVKLHYQARMFPNGEEGSRHFYHFYYFSMILVSGTS